MSVSGRRHCVSVVSILRTPARVEVTLRRVEMWKVLQTDLEVVVRHEFVVNRPGFFFVKVVARLDTAENIKCSPRGRIGR